MTDWQPMGTEPKDGTEFLVYDNRSGCIKVVAWARGTYGALHLFDVSEPTHWMPLPAHPDTIHARE